MQLKKLLTLLVLPLALSGCGDDKTYISKNPLTCRDITYNCPQFQSAFSSLIGCGCAADEAMTEPPLLRPVISDYLADHILQPSAGGKVFAEYVMLASGEKNEGRIADYQVWAVAKEYYLDGTELQERNTVSLPVSLALQSTGKNYIIWSHEAPADGAGYDDSVREIFLSDAQEWIFDHADHEGRQSVLEAMQTGTRNQAMEFFLADLMAAREAAKAATEEAAESVETDFESRQS